MEYEEYLKEKLSLRTPTEISSLLSALTERNIFENSRERLLVEYRSLLCYLLREKLNMGWTNIAEFMKSNEKAYNHATAMHAYKMYPIYKKNNKKLLTLEKKFNIKEQEEYEELLKVKAIQKKYRILEAEYFKTLTILSKYDNSINHKGLTENEVKYRTLTVDEKIRYDRAADLMLKSFIWKSKVNKEKFEIINCHT